MSADSKRHRRNLQQWVLNEYGDGTTAPCYECGRLLDRGTLTIDRIKPGLLGGKYIRSNCRPACNRCNSTRLAREYVELVALVASVNETRVA